MNVVPKPKKNYKRNHYSWWSGLVIAHFNNKCAVCGSACELTAHHIISKSNKLYHLSVDNGISLCWEHHNNSKELSAHGNPEAFCEWLRENYPRLHSLAVRRLNRINP